MARHVTVIGAGIVGISCARHLQQRGFKVTVVDRLLPGEATSFGNACIITDSSFIPIPGPGIVKSGLKMLLDAEGPLFIRPNYVAKVSPWLYKFIRSGKLAQVQLTVDALSDLLRGVLHEHQELAKNTAAAQWIGTDPTLYVYQSEIEYQSDILSWDLRKARGVDFETIDGNQLHELESSLAANLNFAAVMNGHGKALNPSKLTKAHAEQLVQDGGQLLQRDIKSIQTGENGPTRLLTDQEPLDLDLLLIAAGAWSARLSETLGSKVPLESEGGYHATIQNVGFHLRHPIMSTKAKIAVTDMEQGLRIGGLVEFAGLDSEANFGRTELLLKTIKKIFPKAQTGEYTEWRGHRPTITDSLPVIGQSPHFANVYYAFGHQHVGLSSGPKTGKLIAQLMAGEATDIDLTPFRIDRFK